MSPEYVDDRKNEYDTIVAVGGGDEHTVKLPIGLSGQQEVRDLVVSIANQTASRGVVNCWLVDSATNTIVYGTVVDESQVALRFAKGAIRGIVIPPALDISVYFYWSNSVAADSLVYRLGYTLRRFVYG